MINCAACNQSFDNEKEIIRLGDSILFQPKLCPSCREKEHHAKRSNGNPSKEKKTLMERYAHFRKLCPAQYLENDIANIQQEAWEKVLAWKQGVRGLLCCGVSQRGKSTTCWRLLEKLYVDNDVKFEALTEAEFGQRTADANASRIMREWVQHLAEVPVLFLDDIGHAAATTKYLQELYLVIEKRTAWQKPIIATTQFDTGELEGKTQGAASVKTVQAILNRLKAHCEMVEF